MIGLVSPWLQPSGGCVCEEEALPDKLLGPCWTFGVKLTVHFLHTRKHLWNLQQTVHISISLQHYTNMHHKILAFVIRQKYLNKKMSGKYLFANNSTSWIENLKSVFLFSACQTLAWPRYLKVSWSDPEETRAGEEGQVLVVEGHSHLNIGLHIATDGGALQHTHLDEVQAVKDENSTHNSAILTPWPVWCE